MIEISMILAKTNANYQPNFLAGLLGRLFEFIFNTVEGLGLQTQHISDYAVTLIIMGLLYKLITLPTTIQNAKNAEKQRLLQPEMEKLKEKYGYDQQIYQQKLMEFQRENKLMAGTGKSCLMLIIQMVVVFALLSVINNADYFLGKEKFAEIHKNFFWIPNLSLADPTGFALPFINSLSQLAYSWLNSKNMAQANPQAAGMNTMLYVMPLMMFFIFRGLAAGVVLYWTVGNFLEVIIRGLVKLFRLATGKTETK